MRNRTFSELYDYYSLKPTYNVAGSEILEQDASKPRFLQSEEMSRHHVARYAVCPYHSSGHLRCSLQLAVEEGGPDVFWLFPLGDYLCVLAKCLLEM